MKAGLANGQRGQRSPPVTRPSNGGGLVTSLSDGFCFLAGLEELSGHQALRSSSAPSLPASLSSSCPCQGAGSSEGTARPVGIQLSSPLTYGNAAQTTGLANLAAALTDDGKHSIRSLYE